MTGMAGSTRRAGSRLIALLTAGLLGLGLTVAPGAVALASDPESEPGSTIVVAARFKNPLCVLFPDLAICKNKK